MMVRQYIHFSNLNTRDLHLRYVERDAPTPEEKEIIEEIPFSQGVFDFSDMMGEKFYGNREISYVFKAFTRHYSSRQLLERKLKSQLMMTNNQKLMDSHDPDYFWMGKCKSVSVEDDHLAGVLIVSIVFDLYPFAFRERMDTSDVWDTFNFDEDVAQVGHYQVNGSREFLLINAGNASAVLEIETSNSFTMSINHQAFGITKGHTKDERLRLSVGENRINITGTGTIQLNFRREVMI